MKVLYNDGHDASREGVLAEVLEHAVHLVVVAVGVVAHLADLIAVGLANESRLIRPVIPDVRFEVMVSSQIEGEEATIVWDQTSCPVNVRIFVHEDKGMVYRMSSGEGEPIFADVPEKDMVCEIATFAAAIRGDEAAVGKVATLERTTLDSLHARRGWC